MPRIYRFKCSCGNEWSKLVSYIPKEGQQIGIATYKHEIGYDGFPDIQLPCEKCGSLSIGSKDEPDNPKGTPFFFNYL